MLKKIYVKLYITIATFVFAVSTVFANPLDDNCHQFVQTAYPVVPTTTHVEYKCQKRYGVAYDNSYKIPVYVATYVTADEMGGKIVRGNHFYVDSVMNDTATPADYVGTQYDKGHLAEAELFTTDNDAMIESFCMCNMHPQWYNFNRGIWHALENYSHKLITQNGSAYIISGTVYGPKSKAIGHGATVPEYSWKIITVPKTNTTEAYMIPNGEHEHENFKQYKVTVRDIEIATGLKF